MDLIDFGQFRAAFGQPVGGAVYLAYLDANNDGVIDLLDFGQLRARFGQTVFP